MLVEVLADELPHVGKRGVRKDLPPDQARVLILMKKVRQVDDELPVRSTRRIYHRRDMQAENTRVLSADSGQAAAAEPVAEEPRTRRRRQRDDET